MRTENQPIRRQPQPLVAGENPDRSIHLATQFDQILRKKQGNMSFIHPLTIARFVLSTYVHIFAPPSNKYLKIKR
jgi:hypothetical protein